MQYANIPSAIAYAGIVRVAIVLTPGIVNRHAITAGDALTDAALVGIVNPVALIAVDQIYVMSAACVLSAAKVTRTKTVEMSSFLKGLTTRISTPRRS